MRCHGLSGIGCCTSGSLACPVLYVKHVEHISTNYLMSFDIPGQNKLSRALRSVPLIPTCPLCVSYIMILRNDLGITTFSALKTIPLSMLNSSL